MKNIFLNSKTCLAILLFSLASACSPSKPSHNSGDGFSAGTLQELAADGEWKVTYYYDGSNLTPLFNNAKFTFQTGGNLRVLYGSDTLAGYWATGFAEPNISFTIDFDSSGTNFNRLDNSWLLISANNQEIKLADTAQMKADTDYLTFSKL